MSKVDEELTRRLHTAERQVNVDGLFEGLERRRAHREVIRRARVAFLTLAVVAGTIGGFVALSHAFRERPRRPAAPLPTNGQIVFSDRASDGHEHLFGIDPDGSGLRQITDFETDDTDPAVSPDGRTVAFVHELEDRGPVVGSIPIDGGMVTWLTDEDLFVTGGPSWSPDGSRIAFAAHDGDGQRLFVMNANGTDQHPLTGDDLYWVETPAWSPDGARIAFTASQISGDEEPSRWDLFTIRPDGTDLVNVTESPDEQDDEGAPTWAPDGDRLAFSRPEGDGVAIVVRRLSDGTETRLTDGATVDTSPAWSPDGRVIAFDRASLDRGGFDVWSMRPDGTELTRLTSGGGFGAAWQPVPAGSEPTPTVSPEPSPSPTPEPEGKDIGLGFNLCDSEGLGGIDFLGNGTKGQAWTGVPVRDDGRCPTFYDLTYVVAADLDGDGLADTFSRTIDHCLYCRPFDVADFDADGDEEVVVLWSHSSTPAFMIYAVADGEIAPVLVAEPGHPAGRHEPGEPLTFNTGGDEGFAGWVRCEDFPASPVLVITWRDHPIEGDTMEVHETRFVLQDDGMFHVVGTTDYSAPVGDQIPGVSDESACGVNWQV